MTREVAQTTLALISELPARAWQAADEAEAEAVEAGGADDDDHDDAASDGGGGACEPEVAATAADGAPLIELLPEIRRTAILAFHGEPAEAVAARSPLVAMLLKHAKVVNGEYKCPLVQAANELSLDAHAAVCSRAPSGCCACTFLPCPARATAGADM